MQEIDTNEAQKHDRDINGPQVVDEVKKVRYQ